MKASSVELIYMVCMVLTSRFILNACYFLKPNEI